MSIEKYALRCDDADDEPSECKGCANNGNDYCFACYNVNWFIPLTNADRIRGMTDEELAYMFVDIGECDRRCPAKIGDCIFSDSACKDAWLSWLKSPVEVDG